MKKQYLPWSVMFVAMRLAPWLLVAGLGLFGKYTYDGRRRAEGREAIVTAQRDAAIVASAKREDSLRAAFTRERTDLNLELARWQAMRERIRILPKWDTLPPDTVPGPERIVERVVTRSPTAEEILEQANRTISACTLTLGTCEARVSNLLARTDSLTVSANYWRRKSDPSFLTQASTAGKWMTVGAVLALIFGRY